MAEHTYQLTIASVGETLFSGEVISATLPGTVGVFTVLAHHEPFVSTLQKGEVMIRITENETKTFSIESGIVECSNDRVSILL